jgi:hypothetical protein
MPFILKKSYKISFFYVVILVCFYAPNMATASPPDRLFKVKWAEKCATEHGVETSEYTVFSKNAWCIYFVDTFRVQQVCEDARFESLGTNRVSMRTKPNNKYIVEFLWGSQISIMQVVKDKPYTLKQVMSLGRAEARETLLTHHLYCP